MAVDNVSYDASRIASPKNSSRSLLMGRPFFGAHGDGFMQQSLLIDLDVTWKEAENSVKTKIRLSILAEQEPYFIYLVT
mgnify:CR=1 FL=1